MTMDYVELLGSTDIFSKLDANELEAVSRCIVEQGADAGEVLITEGQPGEALFLIRDGKVIVQKKHEDKTVDLAELAAGSVFGEMSLIDSFPTSATVTALEKSSFLLVSRLDLNVLLNWDTLLAAKMWRSFTEMLCYRVRASNERLLARFGEDATRELIGSTDGIQAK